MLRYRVLRVLRKRNACYGMRSTARERPFLFLEEIYFSGSPSGFIDTWRAASPPGGATRGVSAPRATRNALRVRHIARCLPGLLRTPYPTVTRRGKPLTHMYLDRVTTCNGYLGLTDLEELGYWKWYDFKGLGKGLRRIVYDQCYVMLWISTLVIRYLQTMGFRHAPH